MSPHALQDENFAELARVTDVGLTGQRHHRVRLSTRWPGRGHGHGQRAHARLALATHVMPLDQGPDGYQMFEQEEDGCVRAVFRPAG